MPTTNKVQHEGVVKSLSQKTIDIVIISHSACAECHAKSACGMADRKEKIITAQRPLEEIKPGDPVIIYATTRQATYSVILAYIMPSILLIAGILLMEKCGIGELYAAVYDLMLLAIYFFLLYFLRHKISRNITFTVERKTTINHKT